MTIDDIRLLYQYDRWANNRVLHAASRLSAEEFARDLGGIVCKLRSQPKGPILIFVNRR